MVSIFNNTYGSASPSTSQSIMKVPIDSLDETKHTVEYVKKLIVTTGLKLNSINPKFMKLIGQEKELKDEEKLNAYSFVNEEELLCFLNEDALYDLKALYARFTNLNDLFIEINKIYEENKNLISAIEEVEEVNKLDYLADYQVEDGNPKFVINEEKLTVAAADIIEKFEIDEILLSISDHFNDKIPYADCKTFGKMIDLNEKMMLPLIKYNDLFEPENKRILVILFGFADNYLILNRNLRKLKKLLTDEDSNLMKLKEIEDHIMEQFHLLMSKGVKFTKGFHSSCLITPKYAKVIFDNFLPSSFKNGNFKLLYRLTKDGKGSSYFHRLCDNQGPTLTVIKDSRGYIFGGFTTVGWAQTSSYYSDSNAFLFTLHNPHSIPPTKFTGSDSNAIYCNSSYGPTFGSGHDIYVDSSFSSCSISFPSTFRDTTGKGNAIFTGNTSFDVSEMEVWQCQPAVGAVFSGSNILDRALAVSLMVFLPTGCVPTLLYRSSEDGKSASDFHRKCDSKGPTVTIIRDVNGYVFGGYTAVNWYGGSNAYANDTTAFLFSLKNPRGAAPAKYNRNTSANSYAIYNHNGYGPTFGGGHDIYVDNTHSNGCYLNFPYSYIDSTGAGNATFTGAYNFTPSEIEVWRV